MMRSGSLAIANVHGQVTIVQASRTHSQSESWIDVYTYIPFGVGLFLVSDVPSARIKKSDVLRVIDVPKHDPIAMLSYLGDSTSSLGSTAYSAFSNSSSTLSCDDEQEMLEVSPEAYREFAKLRDENERRCESLWKRLYTGRRR